MQEARPGPSIYAGHYTGLQTYGLSGMTIQDELIDHALMACENRRAAYRGSCSWCCSAANGGKLYTGCDAMNGDSNSMGRYLGKGLQSGGCGRWPV